MKKVNDLIFGKNKTERVVSVEPGDGVCELFIEDPNGIITSKFIKQKYWILSHTQLGKEWIRLKGNLHYKWGKQFDNRDEYLKSMNYLRNKDVYTIWDSKENILVNSGISYYKGMKPSDVSILSFDIETDGLKHHSGSRVFLISNTFRRNGKIIKKLFCYDEYENDGEMLEDWCDWVRGMNPSILCGHNVNGYDLLYMRHVAAMYDKELLLGRDGSALVFAKKESKFRVDGSRDLHYKKVKCYGREIVDTMFLAYKYDAVARKYQSYGLKPIIKQEKLEKEGRVFYDASKIKDNIHIPEERAKIIDYCRDDSDDSLSLIDLMMPAQFYWAQMVPKPFQMIIEGATGSQINSMMVRSYLQEAHSVSKADQESIPFEGAISDGYAGVYKNCIKWDVASLYPSIVLQYSIYDKVKDPKANFLQIMKYLTHQRLSNKSLAKSTGDKYYKDLEQSQKIGINSGYGFLGASGCNFNSFKNAALVTQYGREILMKAIKFATGRDYIPSVVE